MNPKNSIITACIIGMACVADAKITLEPIGTTINDSFLGNEDALFDASATEIVSFDLVTNKLFVTNSSEVVLGSGNPGIDIFDLSNPANPGYLTSIDISALGNGVTHVDVRPGGGILAASITTGPDDTGPGIVAFIDTTTHAIINMVVVGALPDQLVYTPDGEKVLTANEGQPNDDYDFDPEGSVSIIDVSGGEAGVTQDDVSTADFQAFNGKENMLRKKGIRIFGPGASAAQDFEPEYVAISPDSKTAYVVLQENNAMAEIDIAAATVTKIWPLGYKNHQAKKNALDPSNRDDGIEIDNWPVKGMYQPDAITVVQEKGVNYIITANEGDARDYDGFSEEVRVADLADIDEGFQLNKGLAKLVEDEDLGRLRTTSHPPSGKSTKVIDGEEIAFFNTIYAYGARSFSIWKSNGSQVFDSGDDFEQITAAALGENFNSDNGESDSGDSRSDDKGPEPEGLTTGIIDGKTYVFIGLERVGGIMIYDVTNPKKPVFCNYARDLRDFTVEFNEDDLTNFDAVGDLGPEGLEFIPAGSISPTSPNLLVVANEVSGTITVYEVVEL